MNCPMCGVDRDYCQCGHSDCPLFGPDPTYPIEDECGYHQHVYYGDDDISGRCYCGKVRYPIGGLTND